MTAEGFVRDEPTLPQKVLKRIEKWHEGRGKQSAVQSLYGNDGGS